MSSKDLSTSRMIMGIIEINFKMEVKTGLIIRAPLAKMVIGGADQQPMSTRLKYVIDNREEEIEVPYIPGSSLKGRIRSLLELYEGAELFSHDGRIFLHVRDLRPDKKQACKNVKHHLDNLFGSPSIQIREIEERGKENKKAQKLIEDIVNLYVPTRLIVRDMYPTMEYIKQLYKLKGPRGIIAFDDFLEEKTENRIDRITSAADPRTIYRIKPGVEFEGSMSIVLYDVDVDPNKLDAVKEYLKLIAIGLKLVEDTYLGGAGTRGYGRVKFKNITVKLKTRDYYITGDPSHIIELKKDIRNVEELLRSIDEVYDKISSQVKTE